MELAYLITIHTSVILLFTIFIFMIFNIRKELRMNIETNRKIFDRIDNIDHRTRIFQEAAIVVERIERDSIAKLNQYTHFPEYLRRACLQGISDGMRFLKTIYIRDNFDREYVIDHVRNIFTNINLSEYQRKRSLMENSEARIRFEENNKNFSDDLETELLALTIKIANEIQRFKAGNYNGKTYDKFVELGNNIITMIINVIDFTYRAHS